MKKTSELTGALLDFWVARAEGLKEPEIDHENDECVFIHHEEPGDDGWYTRYAPSRTWSEAGPFLGPRVYNVEARCNTIGPWSATAVVIRDEDRYRDLEMFGDTPLEAICRAVVRAVFGDEVEEVADGL